MLWYVARNVVGKLNFVDCVIYQSDPARTELHQVAAWGEKNPYGRNILNPLIIPFGRGITGQVAQTQKPIVIEDLLQDHNYIPDTQVARSEICVPLVVRGEVVGVIDSEHPEPGAFGETELEILGTVAAMTSAKLELLAETERSADRYQDLVASHAQLTREITARKALEARLFEARKLEALGQLTGRFAHEFNNILTVVLGNLELADAASDLPEDVAPCLAEAHEAAQRGARLMRDMLVFAQRTRLAPVVLEPDDFVTGFARVAGRRTACPLELDLGGAPWRIAMDRGALTDVLKNLVDNACDAMVAAMDGGSVTLSTGQMTLELGEAPFPGVDLPPGRYVRFSVSDTGTGIPAQRREQIFDPFYTTKPVGAGTGLGLSIVRGFVQQSGGAVAVVSETDPTRAGTTFHVLLPALPESTESPGTDDEQDGAHAHAQEPARQDS
nr:ATP-binding protein [Sagittula salina]